MKIPVPHLTAFQSCSTRARNFHQQAEGEILSGSHNEI